MKARRNVKVGGALILLMLFGGLLAALGAGRAWAAEREYPSREIEFVVPFPPGGPADTAARIITPKMSSILGVPVVIVNKPGGGGRWGRPTWPRRNPMVIP